MPIIELFGGGQMAVRYKCVWVREVPRKMLTEYYFSLGGSDVTQASLDKMAESFFNDHPHLDPKKKRLYGMLVEVHHPKPCVRYAFSRSASNLRVEDGLWHSAETHLGHKCFIDKDAMIQTNVGSGMCIPINVFRFLRLDPRPCERETLEVVEELTDHMKTKFPGKYICVTGGGN
jgi:hypothetical protein